VCYIYTHTHRRTCSLDSVHYLLFKKTSGTGLVTQHLLQTCPTVRHLSHLFTWEQKIQFPKHVLPYSEYQTMDKLQKTSSFMFVTVNVQKMFHTEFVCPWSISNCFICLAQPIQWLPGVLSPGVKWPGGGADCSPLSCATVWSHTSSHPIHHHGVVLS